MKWILKCLLCLLLFAFMLQAGEALAQSEPWPSYGPGQQFEDPHSIVRGPGGYLAWWKLLLIVLVFLVWIKMADWMNRDAITYQDQHQLEPEIWNPIMVFSFLLGLFGAVVNIPFFLLGFPAFLLAAFVPFGTYLLMRRGKVDKSLVNKESDTVVGIESTDPIFQLITIKAAGDNAEQKQSNLIIARQSPTFPQLLQMLYDAVYRRSDVMILDYSKDQVVRRVQIDGAWIDMPPIDRASGDAMLISLKQLAGLNPSDRRNRQQGRFTSKIRRLEIVNDVTSQGVPTGERVILKFATHQKQPMEFTKLGMWPDQYDKFRNLLNDRGYFVVSAPATHGLSVTWQAVLHSTDRFISDWVAVVDHDEFESDMENIEEFRFNSQQGGSPADILPSLLLKQPSGLVVPNPVNARSIDILTKEIVDFDRSVLSRLHAKSAVEAILRLMTLSQAHKDRYVKSLGASVCQRLVRRLCDSCKQPAQSNPNLIKQLGGDPNDPPTIYTHCQLPPPDQRVDEKGKPIEFPPCSTCGGIGYIGRVAVYEILFVDKKLREAILKEPKLESVSKVAQESGHQSLPQQGYRLVLEGITSIQEVQRVMKSS